MMNLYGIPKSVYRAFERVRSLGDQQLAVVGEHATINVTRVDDDHANPGRDGERMASTDYLKLADATASMSASEVAPAT